MSNSLQMKDVYDYAFDIAQEFDKIVDVIDIDFIKPLINKIIGVLEQLECNVNRLEQLEQDLFNLRKKCTQLKCERNANEAEKLQLKQSFEELEEAWSRESTFLKGLIAKLKKENNILMQSIPSEKEIPKENDYCLDTVIRDQKNVITKLQLHLNQKTVQQESNQAIIEQLNLEIEDLLKLNKSLHHRNQEVKHLLQASYSEKYEHKIKQDQQEQKIKDLENIYDDLQEKFKEKSECTATKDVQSHETSSVITDKISCQVQPIDTQCLVQEKNELKKTVLKLQNELAIVHSQCEEYKRKLNKLSNSHNGHSTKENGYIQEIFRLFLGAVHINV